jgi:hypothetical protein
MFTMISMPGSESSDGEDNEDEGGNASDVLIVSQTASFVK